jgi:hypothetical protein
MTKLPRVAAPFSSVLAGSLLLAGCAAEPQDEAAPPPADRGAHAGVGSFVMHVQPQARRVDVRRLPDDLVGPARYNPQNLQSLPIVSDSSTGTGPDSSVELATTSVTDTFGKGLSGTCPAGSFCGDVQFTHFYRGLNLSAVYAQVTAITDSSGTIDTKHAVTNGVASTPFGLDVSLGAWAYTTSPGSLAYGAGSTKSWVFNNPDDADFYVYLDVKAALFPTLWFGKTGLTTTAQPVAGTPFTVHYEYARNTGCGSATNYVWNGWVKATNIDAQHFSFQNVATDTFFDVEVATPFVGGMDLWFNKDALGGTSCTSWDGGNNFNVGIANPLPAIHFGGPNSAVNPYNTVAWNVYRDTGVVGGAKITVDYEPDRIACLTLDRYRRLPAGTFIKMGYAFDGSNAYTEVAMTGKPAGIPTGSGAATRDLISPPTISIPSGSHSMKVYFYTNASTCSNGSNYDSNFSNNFQFSY